MDKQKFDYYWKIALIVILVLGMLYMFWQFNQLNKKGLECYSAPFDYGVKEAERQGVYCYYNCLKGDVDWAWNQKIDLDLS